MEYRLFTQTHTHTHTHTHTPNKFSLKLKIPSAQRGSCSDSDTAFDIPKHETKETCGQTIDTADPQSNPTEVSQDETERI